MLRNVQRLRAVAAVMVVIGHLQPLLAAADSRLAWVGLGRAGVDLFFVISGFVMVYTTRRAEPDALGFAWRRIVRIAPLYWACTLVVFTLALIAPHLLGASRPEPVWLMKSLAFVPFVKGDGSFDPLLPVGWTLNYEMFFYAVLAASMTAGRGRQYWICGGAILALSAAGFARAPLPGVAAAFYTRPILVEFVLGMALGQSFDALPATRGGRGAAAAGAGLLACILALVASGLAPDEPQRVVIAAAAAAGVLFFALVLERGGLAPMTGLGLVIGDASYSLYLTHVFIIQGVRWALGAARRTGPADCLAGALVALAGALAVAVAVYRLFEAPATRALKTLPVAAFPPLRRSALPTPAPRR